MCDSDIDDDYLLEAVEEVEKSIDTLNSSEFQFQSTPPDIFITGKSTEYQNNLSSSLVGASNLLTSKPTSFNEITESQPFSGDNINRPKLFHSLHKQNETNIIPDQISTFKPLSEIVHNNKPKDDFILESIKKTNDSLNICDGHLRKRKIEHLNSSITQENNNHKSPDFATPTRPTTSRKRKFPGPAGILPSANTFNGTTSLFKSLKTNSDTSLRNGNKDENDLPCSQSQTNDSSILNDVYEKIEEEISEICDDRNVLKKFNIKWLQQQRRHNFRSQKIPLLAVVIRNIDLSHLYVDAVFKDKTGEIKGDIDKLVIEKYGSILTPGSGILLKNLCVLARLGTKSGLPNHYLNITLNSIVSIYSRDSDISFKATSINSLTSEELQKLVSDVEKRATQDLFTEQEEEPESSPLQNSANHRFHSPTTPIQRPQTSTPKSVHNSSSSVQRPVGPSGNFNSVGRGRFSSNTNFTSSSVNNGAFSSPRFKNVTPSNNIASSSHPIKHVASFSSPIISNSFNVQHQNGAKFSSNNANSVRGSEKSIKAPVDSCSLSTQKVNSKAALDAFNDDDMDDLLASIETDGLY